MSKPLPPRADVVIIGGGIVGTLARLSSGQARHHRCGASRAQAADLGHDLACRRPGRPAARHPQPHRARQIHDRAVRGLEDETGQATGFKQNGSISVALSDGRLEELKRGASMARSFGLEVNVISAGSWPSACRIRTRRRDRRRVSAQGRAGQPDRHHAGAGRWRQRAGPASSRIPRSPHRRRQAAGDRRRTAAGDIGPTASSSPPACGRAGSAARSASSIPLHAAEHFYIVTEPIAGSAPQHAGGADARRVHLLQGGCRQAAGRRVRAGGQALGHATASPRIFSFETLPEDMEHFEPILKAAIRRVPLLDTAGIALFFNGPESFTPDDRYYLGETPEVRNLFVAAGFNSIGIQSSGGAGLVLAQWIRTATRRWTCAASTSAASIPSSRSRRYLKRPHGREPRPALRHALALSPAARPRAACAVRPSTTGSGARRLLRRGQWLGAANWFAPAGRGAEYDYSYGRQNWFEPSPRAAGRAQRGRPVRPVLASPNSCSKAATPMPVLNSVSTNDVDVRARPDRLHPMAQRARRHRGRSDRDPSRRGPLPHRLGRRDPDARLRLAEAPYPRGGPGVATDITSGLPMLAVMGPQLAGDCWPS